MVDETRAAALVEQISEEYQEYQDAVAEARRIAKKGIEKIVWDQTHGARTALSQHMQEAHAAGVRKGDLRIATRKYGDNSAFLALYEYYKGDAGERA